MACDFYQTSFKGIQNEGENEYPKHEDFATKDLLS
jgi:hypothetical protein